MKHLGFLLQVSISLLVYHGAASKAVFELDLIKYEALPNKCCDGYRWVKIGPAKCNECDPYFRICMSHMPGGPSKCVTTTRENNVHTTDLTRGNIQPNHLSLDIDNLQGSLAVDVDIKDYDSTSKDDDIDHLFYTFKSIASTESVTVVLNGTKVRLTISLKVSCEPGFYGLTCNTQCPNGVNWICSSNGTKLCRNGYSGPNCSLKPSTSVPLSTRKNAASIQTSTSNAFTPTYTPTSSKIIIVSTSSLTNSTDGSTKSIKVTTRTNDVPNASSAITSESGFTTPTPSIVTSTSSIATSLPSITSSKLTSKIVELVSTPTKTSKVLSTEDVQNTSEQTTIETSTQARQSSTSTASLTTESPNNRISKIMQSTIRRINSSELTTPSTDQTTQGTKLRIPEPLEVYSCNLMIEGHKIGLHQPIENIITYVLKRFGDSTDIDTLQAHVMSSTFEITDNGVDVTDVSFVVQHNGATLTSGEVLRKLYSPQSTKLLTDHLHARNLKQHSITTTITTESPNTTKQWITEHLPFVIVISCVVLFCLLIFATIAGRSIKRRTTSTVQKKEKFPKSVKYNEDQTIQMFSNKVPFDTPFSLDNPLYDYSYDQLQPFDGSNV